MQSHSAFRRDEFRRADGEFPFVDLGGFPGAAYLRGNGRRSAPMAELEGKGPVVAVARVETRQLLKTMHWYDGFVVALANPGFIIASLGYTIGSIGALGALAVWAGSMLIGVLQNKVYTEPATMFPDRSGGIAIYAYEGWRRRFSFAGPMAAIGYWAGWTAVLSIFGLTIGSLMQAQWFASSTWTVNAGIQLSLPRVIAIVAILGVWVTNTLGMRPTKIMGYLTGGLLMVPLLLFTVLPFFIGGYHGSLLSFGLFGAGGSVWGIIRLTIAWLYLNGWSAYGVEVCATFAPEYHDTKRDTELALNRSAIFSMLVYTLLPLGLGGRMSTADIGKNPLTFYVTVLQQEVGPASGVIVVFIIASFVLAMNSATMDGARCLYGLSRSGMIIKWFDKINRFNVPSRGMDVDMVVNILAVLFLPSTVAILAASNLGYFICVVLALSGIVLLRRDRPDWPRPIKLGKGWIWTAGVLAGVNAVLLVIGSVSFSLTGYGGWKEFFIGIALVLVGCGFYAYRRVVEDKKPLRWSDPPTPEELAAGVAAHAEPVAVAVES
jgi:amino acid transporter